MKYPYDQVKMKFWPASLTLAPLAFAGLLLFLAVEIGRHSLGDALSESDPALSTVLDPTQSEARLSISDALLSNNSSKIDEAASEARDALRADPLSPGALTLLARANEQIGDRDRTLRLMTLASRVNPRDSAAQFWLLSYDLQTTDVAEAMKRIDIILRGQKRQDIERLDPILATILTREPYRLAYAKLLLTDPPWRARTDLIRHSTDPSALAYLVTELQAIGPGPTEKELQVVLGMLTDAGMFDEAHDIWLRTIPPDRSKEADLLYNHDFRYPLPNLAFDWAFAPVPNPRVRFESQAGGQVMNVDFFGGRANLAPVSHLLNLAPGTYRFQGRERAQALQNERGLHWRIACIEEGENLGTTEPLNGDSPWRTFEVDFTVPKGRCFYQILILELPARAKLETQVVGGVSYAGLDLQPK
jgi:tetratricopeptide (TPR) repeat protein